MFNLVISLYSEDGRASAMFGIWCSIPDQEYVSARRLLLEKCSRWVVEKYLQGSTIITAL